MAEGHRPGEPAPNTGTYYLFDRYGAPTGCAVSCEAEHPLPLITVNGYGPLLYRLVGDETADAA